MDGELDQVRRIRVTIDANKALSAGSTPEGELSIVKETKSTKYHFLNKRSYEVHTSSTTRVATALSGHNARDKARADRHSDARRTSRPQVERMADGSYRITIAKNHRTAEIHANPSIVSADFKWLNFSIFTFVFLCLGLGTTLKMKRLRVWPMLSFVYFAVCSLGVNSYLQKGLSNANVFLAEGGRRAPLFILPSHELWVYFGTLSLVSITCIWFVCSSRFQASLIALQKNRHAYLSISPALLGLTVLVGIPFVVGMGLAFFRHVHGDFSFVGLQNFSQILQGSEGPHSIFYTLFITILWTSVNVVLHLCIGLALALLLHRYASRWTRVYRVVLIIPWAVPAYLTALIWRSMFDADVGVINRILGLQGMSWMHDTVTAFAANLITNVWLGVPFMMVVCLGALTSIPKDLYDAADVDGANAWQRFTQITLPLLKPALLPAVILGSIWTFNKFEVIYLVSEGRPDGATDILVTEAYRWAFERGLAQGGAYGKAAACSVLIFVVLLLYGWMTARVSRSAEEALR